MALQFKKNIFCLNGTISYLKLIKLIQVSDQEQTNRAQTRYSFCHLEHLGNTPWKILVLIMGYEEPVDMDILLI